MVEISIVLLTKNGGTYLEEVLGKVFIQEIEAEVEVMAIDSGSTDRTKEILAKFPIRFGNPLDSEFIVSEKRIWDCFGGYQGGVNITWHGNR